MKRIIENEESLNVVRAKCIARQTDFDKNELVHLNLCWVELQKSYGKKFVKPLDQSCSNCKITAMNVIHNYIVTEEPSNLTNEQEEDILMGMVIDKLSLELEDTKPEMQDSKPFVNAIEYLQTLSLKELRAEYPHIKAKSIDSFIHKLNHRS